MNNCEHKHIMFDKLNDCNFCEDCNEIFIEDEYILAREDEIDYNMEDEIENNLEGLNML